jgi:hypothetical protein
MEIANIYHTSFVHYTNAMHVELHHQILSYLDDLSAETLASVQDVLSRYRASIESEQKLLNQSTASEFTPEIAALRKSRDSWYKYVRTTIKGARFLEDAESQSAYQFLKARLLDVYPTLSEMKDGQKATAVLRAFIGVAQGECAAAIEVLALSSAIEKLAAANEAFCEKYLLRNTERAQAVPAAMKKARTETDRLYRRLALFLLTLDMAGADVGGSSSSDCSSSSSDSSVSSSSSDTFVSANSSSSAASVSAPSEDGAADGVATIIADWRVRRRVECRARARNVAEPEGESVEASLSEEEETVVRFAELGMMR